MVVTVTGESVSAIVSIISPGMGSTSGASSTGSRLRPSALPIFPAGLYFDTHKYLRSTPIS